MPAHRVDPNVSRRSFLGSASAFAGAAHLLSGSSAYANAPTSLAATPPAGFVPMAAPGKIIKVSKSDVIMPNGLFPKEEAARIMLERAMTELTGEIDLGRAFARFVHKDDKVAVKMNGIAGQTGGTMATNKELILPIVAGILAAGVPAANVVVYEQYTSFFNGTRVNAKNLPAGVVTAVHGNKDATMSEIRVLGIPTKFVRPLTDATAVINVALIKDHSICGYTGCLKNITHGSTINPHDFHQHNASPQIAALYAQDIVKSRVRLHITDGFKLIYDGGPLDKNPDRRVPHEAVYATTDPVAMDVIGWNEVEKWRKEKGLPTLTKAGREPTYIRVAGELGLGIANQEQIRLREVRL
ncbi:MAG TPA: DUF362 domain-containing protein [Polyangiaceae bacterium]|nr:DUF362 domain-containing protein [Polyangiaceae bacterium]